MTTTTTRKKTTLPPPIDQCLFGPNYDVSLADLRRIASQGIVDQGSHRSVAWRILLGYLPENRKEWPAVLEEKRFLYNELVHKVFFSPSENGKELMGHHGKRAREEEKRLEAEQEIDNVVLGVTQVGLCSFVETSSHGVEVNTESDVDNKETTATDDYQNETTIAEDSAEKEEEDVVPHFITKDGTVECVPIRIREQWKKSGRDTGALVEMSNATGRNVYGVNTLLVVDNEGKAVSHNEEEEDDSTEDKWVHFLENASLLDEIRKDVVRTHPDLKFFLEPCDNLGHRRYAAMERILFVWAKLNKGVSFGQGCEG